MAPEPPGTALRHPRHSFPTSRHGRQAARETLFEWLHLLVGVARTDLGSWESRWSAPRFGSRDRRLRGGWSSWSCSALTSGGILEESAIRTPSPCFGLLAGFFDDERAMVEAQAGLSFALKIALSVWKFEWEQRSLSHCFSLSPPRMCADPQVQMSLFLSLLHRLFPHLDGVVPWFGEQVFVLVSSFRRARPRHHSQRCPDFSRTPSSVEHSYNSLGVDLRSYKRKDVSLASRLFLSLRR